MVHLVIAGQCSARWCQVPGIQMVIILSCLLTLSGCGGPAEPARAAVNGTVTLDGTPIAVGTIAFLPTGPEGGPSSGGAILNGKYTLTAQNGPVLGEHKVEIRAPQKTGKQIPVAPPAVSASGTVDEVVESVPAQFNSATTLTRTVEVESNTFDFDLKSQ